MSKQPEAEKASRRLGERAGAFVHSFSLTGEERLLVMAILLSLVLGAAVLHWRSEYRITHPSPDPNQIAAPTPATHRHPEASKQK